VDQFAPDDSNARLIIFCVSVQPTSHSRYLGIKESRCLIILTCPSRSSLHHLNDFLYLPVLSRDYYYYYYYYRTYRHSRERSRVCMYVSGFD
jgi:hypothetical protein